MVISHQKGVCKETHDTTFVRNTIPWPYHVKIEFVAI